MAFHLSSEYGVSHDEVMSFSPTLALNITRQSTAIIALRIVEIVRQDIFESLKKRAAFLDAVRAAQGQTVPIGKIVSSFDS